MHGLALNCSVDLSWFDHIIPCGLEGKGVTSISQETGKLYKPDIVIESFLKNFEKIFNCKYN